MTKNEIETLLQRADADKIASSWEKDGAAVAFLLRERRIRFRLYFPKLNDPDVKMSKRGRMRGKEAIQRIWDQTCRSQWRSLLLCIKAKLESVESGIEVFDEAFLGQIVQPDGTTVAETVLPRIAEIYASGKNIPLLTGPTGA